MEEEYISSQNGETTELHNLLRMFSYFIETQQVDQNSEIISNIFQEYVNSREEPINPMVGYVIRWSETFVDEQDENHIIHYEISYEPQQIQEFLEEKKLSVRQATEHLETYKKIKADDPLVMNKETCPICFDDYKIGQYKRVLSKCKHAFHKKCIDKWFVSHPNLECPLCRTNYKKE